MKLTPKQQRFVAEYLIDLNATQAAIRAGYSQRTARSVASENLTKPDISQEIARQQAQRSDRVEVTQDWVVRELQRIAASDPRKLYDKHGQLKPITELDDDSAASLAGVEIESMATEEGETPIRVRKVKRWEKTKALELLGRHLGMWNDKLQIGLDDDLAARLSAARGRK